MVEWKDILGRKFKNRVVKIISMLGVEVLPSTETADQPFCTRMHEFLKAGKVIESCDPSIKNGVMGAWWFTTTRDKEELMSQEIIAKEWHVNTSKTVEEDILSDLIAKMRFKPMSPNQGKVEVRMDKKYV